MRNETCFQTGRRVDQGPNLTASSNHRYLPYAQEILPLHNAVPFLSDPSSSRHTTSCPTCPACIPHYYDYVTECELVKMTITATPFEPECNEGILHHPGSQSSHPPGVFINPPDGSSVMHLQSHRSVPTIARSNDATPANKEGHK